MKKEGGKKRGLYYFDIKILIIILINFINFFINSIIKNFFSPLILDIKIWMLTGDKLETAENIAKSCKLI